MFINTFMSFSNVGKTWNKTSFKEYLKTIRKPDWVKGICLHHTGIPSLSMRPNGLTSQHIVNIMDFYKSKKWKSGPHLFISESTIHGMTPLEIKGVHAVSFNSSYIGIEVLGNYDFEKPNSGRGELCWDTTAEVVHLLLEWLGLEANETTIKFHRDDPKTNKTCPGNLVKKDWFISLVKSKEMKSIPPPPQKEISKPIVKNAEPFKPQNSFWTKFFSLFK